eukprot:SAG31_NODE_7355_length_1711_cov_3.477667_1_plen_61_part_10
MLAGGEATGEAAILVSIGLSGVTVMFVVAVPCGITSEPCELVPGDDKEFATSTNLFGNRFA